MYNSQLFQTLRLLTQEELEMLQFFVASPLFNNAERFHDSNKLFEHIRNAYPTYTKAGLDKENVGKTIFPGRTKPKDEVEKAMSPLMHVIEQFINVYYSNNTNPESASKTKATKKKPGNKTATERVRDLKQQLALLRFYSERIHQHPAENLKTQAIVPEEGHKIKKPEKFFQNLYNDLKKEITAFQSFSQFDEYAFNDFYYAKSVLEREKALFDSLEEHFEGDTNLMEAIETLDEHYLLSKLELMSRLVHRESIAKPFDGDAELERRYRINFEMTLNTVEFLKTKEYLLSPGIRLYCKLLEFQNSKDMQQADKAAIQFNNLLNEFHQAVPQSRHQVFKIMLRSYWATRYNETKAPKFLEMVHQLHQEDLDIATKNGTGISSSHFQNTMQVAFKLGKTKWAETVLTEFEKKITLTSFAPIIAEIFWALLRFAQKQYKDASKYLPHYIAYGDLDDIHLYAIASTADVKLRFELNTLNDYDYGTSMFKATRQHIERQKMYDKARKERCVNFYKIVRVLFSLKEKSNSKSGIKHSELEAARNMLDTLPIVEKEWLEEKYKELSDKAK